MAVPESYETFRLTRIRHVTAALVDLFPRCGFGSALTTLVDVMWWTVVQALHSLTRQVCEVF